MNVALTLIFLFSVANANRHTHAPHTPPPSTTTQKPKTDHEMIQEMLAEGKKLQDEFNFMKSSLEDLSRQVMLQQFFVEERIRTDGSSGLKQVRNGDDGTRTYYTNSLAARGVAGIHEHSNNVRTVGMGELNVVLNGIEFRTRHNDYRLRMPSKTKKDYNLMENIDFPPVPPAVLNKKTVHEQVLEMREWFRAWKNQDHSVRDYRKYFKPVLSYLEGGWTTNTMSLEEPFFSDRHHIDASSWFDLQDKVRFTSYSGGKSNLENFAYLPTTIMNMKNGTAEFAQWNYRIAVHPLSHDLPFTAFNQVDDLTERMKRKYTMAQLNNTRVARYSLKDHIPYNQKALENYRERSYHWGLLDDLMYEIPGKDNYPGVIYDSAFGLPAYQIKPQSPLKKLNTARYHRWYKVDEKDAMGQKNVHRGFSDPNLFVAQTTNPNIAPVTVNNCKTHRKPGTHHRETTCTQYTERFTYAVPLEIIYITPLWNWNPYHLEYVGIPSECQLVGSRYKLTCRAHRSQSSVYSMPQNVSSGPRVYHILHGNNGTMRNGGLTPDKAYNGTHSRLFYQTPAEFYSSGNTVDHDKADTAKGVIGVLDRHGNVRKVTATGTRIILPEIETVGKIRTRWPIVPLHSDGEQTRKELDALKDMVMKMPTYSSLFEEQPTTVSKANALYGEQEHTFLVSLTTKTPPGPHTHELPIKQFELDILDDVKHPGHRIRGMFTSVENGHQHSVDVQKVNGSYVIVSCDGLPTCWDGHDLHLTKIH